MSLQTAAQRRGNLAPIIPVAQVGPDGALMSPEEIQRRRAALERRQAASQGQAFQPIQHWSQGAAMLVDAASDAFEGRRLSRAEEAGRAENERLMGGLRSYMGSGASDPVAAALAAGGGFGGASTPQRSAGAASIPSGDLASYVRQGLISRGLPEHVADGFLPNFQDESGFNPGINEANPLVAGSRGGFGLYQLTGPRRVAYEGLATQRGVGFDDVDTQLDFLAAELGLPGTGLEDQPFFGSESRAAERILAAPDTASAAQSVLNDFLRPSQEHRQRRNARYAGLSTTALAESHQGIAPAALSYEDLAAGRSRYQPRPDMSAQMVNSSGGYQPGAVIPDRVTVYDQGGLRTVDANEYARQARESYPQPENVRPYSGPGASIDGNRVQAGAPAAAAPVQVASLDPSIGMPTASQRDRVAEALMAPASNSQPGGARPDVAGALLQPQGQQAQPQSAPNVQMAQALFPNGYQSGGINPALLEAATSPYASESTRSVAQALMQNEMQRQNWVSQQVFQQQMQERDPLRQIQIQAAQQGIEQGQALINVGGGQLYNPNNGEWISAPGAGQGANVPDAFQTLQLRAQAAGLQPGTPEFQSFMANGGRSAEDSAAEQRIGRLTENLMATGAILDPTQAYNLAVGMVDGRYAQGRDPITGNLQIVDTATGSVLFDGRSQGGGNATSAPSNEPAVAPGGPGAAVPASSEFGERYPNAPESFGLAGTAQRAANTIGDTVGIGAPFPDVQTTQASFDVLQESLLNDVQGAYGRQPPSWLLRRIDDLTPKAGVPWQGPGGAVVKLQALGNHLQTELQLAQQSSGRDMNPERRQALEEKIIGLEAGLGRIRQAINAFGPADAAAGGASDAAAGDVGQEYQDGMTATNPETGERLILRNGQWEAVQ